MQNVAKFRYILMAAGLAALAALPLRGQGVLARAEANPSVVMVGETATYAIRFLNTSSVPNLNTPRVDGLNFSDTPSTSSFQQLINGRASIETELSWSFRAVREGNFTIPGRSVQIGGEQIRIPDVEVRVVPVDEQTRSRAFLRLDLADPPYYVGEAIPARLSLLVRRDLNLANIAFPRSEGDAFQHTEFDNNPARGSTQIKGVPYNVLSWEIVITPIKAGQAELSFSQDIALQVIEQDSRFPSIFSMSRARTETATVFTDKLGAEVLPLPAAGRPDSFLDAIGQFSLTSSVSATDLTVGEPMTLTLTLSGKGNFDRISPPLLPEAEGWKLYPPKTVFTPADKRGLEGSKSFEYILIPQSESVTALPPIRYASFDPQAGGYRETVLDPVPVSVKPSSRPVDDGPLLGFGKTEEKRAKVPEKILPLRAEPGALHPAGTVLLRQPGFWLANIGVAGVLLAGAVWQRRCRRLESDARLARRHFGSRRVRKAVQAAQHAAAAGDAAAFFRSARFAVQESVSHLAKRHVEAKTLVSSDCLAILEAQNVPQPVTAKTASLLDAADSCEFAGIRPGAEELLDLHKDLISIVSGLNRLTK